MIWRNIYIILIIQLEDNIVQTFVVIIRLYDTIGNIISLDYNVFIRENVVYLSWKYHFIVPLSTAPFIVPYAMSHELPQIPKYTKVPVSRTILPLVFFFSKEPKQSSFQA
jgi:hypothetical protein